MARQAHLAPRSQRTMTLVVAKSRLPIRSGNQAAVGVPRNLQAVAKVPGQPPRLGEEREEKRGGLGSSLVESTCMVANATHSRPRARAMPAGGACGPTSGRRVAPGCSRPSPCAYSPAVSLHSLRDTQFRRRAGLGALMATTVVVMVTVKVKVMARMTIRMMVMMMMVMMMVMMMMVMMMVMTTMMMMTMAKGYYGPWHGLPSEGKKKKKSGGANCMMRLPVGSSCWQSGRTQGSDKLLGCFCFDNRRVKVGR